jgi:hypothetical protein
MESLYTKQDIYYHQDYDKLLITKNQLFLKPCYKDLPLIHINSKSLKP